MHDVLSFVMNRVTQNSDKCDVSKECIAPNYMLPSEEEFEGFMFLNFGQRDSERSGHHMKIGAQKTFHWLRDNMKPTHTFTNCKSMCGKPAPYPIDDEERDE